MLVRGNAVQLQNVRMSQFTQRRYFLLQLLHVIASQHLLRRDGRAHVNPCTRLRGILSLEESNVILFDAPRKTCPAPPCANDRASSLSSTKGIESTATGFANCARLASSSRVTSSAPDFNLFLAGPISPSSMPPRSYSFRVSWCGSRFRMILAEFVKSGSLRPLVFPCFTRKR